MGRKKKQGSRRNFIFEKDVDRLLTDAAIRTNRTMTSIIEQLVRQFCTAKNI